MEIAASQYGTTFHSVFAVTRWNTLSINSATLSNSNNPQQVIRINEIVWWIRVLIHDIRPSEGQRNNWGQFASGVSTFFGQQQNKLC